MVFSAALEKKGDDDDPKAVEKKRFGRRSVQFLEERLCRSRFFGPRKRRLRDTSSRRRRDESRIFFFLEKTLRVGSQRNAFFSITSSWEIDRKVVAQEK